MRLPFEARSPDNGDDDCNYKLMITRTSKLRVLEFVLLTVGLVLCVFACFTYFGGRIYSREAIARFRAQMNPQPASMPLDPDSLAPVDFKLWSRTRIEQYKASLAEKFEQPLAVLKVDKIQLQVAVFEGTSDRVLNRGVGTIEGTARIGESGNIGIAGHRDGFFRGLKDVGVGDSIQLENRISTQTYRIDSIKLVNRNDVSVLESRSSPELTLVTCFPFYFVGNAPQRYIVHASLIGEIKTLNEPAKASLQATASRTKENTP